MLAVVFLSCAPAARPYPPCHPAPALRHVACPLLPRTTVLRHNSAVTTAAAAGRPASAQPGLAGQHATGSTLLPATCQQQLAGSAPPADHDRRATACSRR